MPSEGEQIAGYQVEEFIARGGMAVVYRARDLSLGRRVALKLIAPELASDEKFRMRFIRESELAASIDHPNILPIYQAGEADGLLYIAMRYVDGSDLGGLLAEHGPLDPDVTLSAFAQVAAALDTAHEHGLVHRDVKPGNILLSRSRPSGEGHVYLADFGLTKRTSSMSDLTATGHFIGTIAYVAPEQIAGKEVTARADIYAMGCVLYEALAGVPPFQRDDEAALLWAHMSESPTPISQLRPELPAALDGVLEHAMAKDPADRPDSCGRVIDELRAALRSEPVAVQPVPAGPGPGRVSTAGRLPVRRRGWLLPGAVIACLLLAAAGLLTPRLLPPGFERYEGASASASWLAFDRPRDWSALPELLTTCFCTDQYGPVFDSGDWRTVIAAIGADRSVEGLFVKQTRGTLNLDDAQAVSELMAGDLLEDRFGLLQNNKKQGLDKPVLRVLGGRSAWEADGTLIASKDPSLRLTIRYFLVHNAAGTSTDHLIVFARDKDSAAAAERIRRVTDSITFRADG